MAISQAKHKADLIARINSIEDRNMLDEVYRLLGVAFEDDTYQTISEQKKEIEEARLQLSRHQGIPSTQADAEIEKWLSE